MGGGARKPSSMKPVKAAMVDETEVNQSEFSDERIQKTKEQLMAELTKEDAPAGFSGLNGKALVLNKDDFPTMAEVAAAIPAHCKVLDTKKSHVPKETGDGYAHFMRELRFNCGKLVHGLWSMWVGSTGWVLYLMFGASGGPAYGLTNHFWPKGVFKTKLFPKKWHAKVITSGAAVIGVVAALAYWAKCTSFATVAAVYGGPWAIMT